MLLLVMIFLLVWMPSPQPLYAYIPPSTNLNWIRTYSAAPNVPIPLSISLSNSSKVSDNVSIEITVYLGDGFTIDFYRFRTLTVLGSKTLVYSLEPFSFINQQKSVIVTLNSLNNIENPVQTIILDIECHGVGEIWVDPVSGITQLIQPTMVTGYYDGGVENAYDSYDFSMTLSNFQKEYPSLSISQWQMNFQGATPQPLNIDESYLLVKTTENWPVVKKRFDQYYFPLQMNWVNGTYRFNLKYGPILDKFTGEFMVNTSLPNTFDLLFPLTMEQNQSLEVSLVLIGIGYEKVTLILKHTVTFSKTLIGPCSKAYYCARALMPKSFTYEPFSSKVWR